MSEVALARAFREERAVILAVLVRQVGDLQLAEDAVQDAFEAASGITVLTPFGMVEYRPIDHQSTMGAYVGKVGVKDGKGYMKDWRFVDGKDVLPSDDEIKKMRPAN